MASSALMAASPVCASPSPSPSPRSPPLFSFVSIDYILCKDSLVQNPDHLTVAMDYLDGFDVELSNKILNLPSDYLPLFLKFVEKTAPVAVYTSRKGSSAAGLTASVIQDNNSAALLTKDICQNLDIVAQRVKGIKYTVVLRGDSTLCGHFPEEADVVVWIFGEMDAWIICPFFLQGGRYTLDDIHYVVDSDSLVPALETEFSKDATFGYKSSNLREWVEEKTKGRIASSSISISLLRIGCPTVVYDLLCSLQKLSGILVILGAITSSDIPTKALEAKCAKVIRQALDEVPCGS